MADLHTPAEQQAGAGLPFPNIRSIGVAAPLRWVARGFSDFLACARASLFYGFCFTAMGLLSTAILSRAYEYIAAVTSGFMLVAPFFAMGIYELSRQREKGSLPALWPTLTVWRHNAGNIAVFAAVLGVIFLVWARASLVIFAMFYTSELPTLEGFIDQVLSLDNLEFLVAYFGVGFIFALLVFALSVVAIPLMLDRNQDAITAMLASARALALNPVPLTIWAFLIVTFTLVGFISFHLGLAVMIPIIGHATWHAYRDLVEPLKR
ncbi:DUF2189 domain-containing protein [Zoogloea sp.]|uniref:DUF2189 domain-containing protein n=1 Tax=Zoogloea sp. TaxID=49181 RepID=UPI002627E93D|nr:DUF2189 domain-containing protein [Zoogloea sp.]MDD3354773.1 DUF2189 domain-containing protein [Zoogloea sp.]